MNGLDPRTALVLFSGGQDSSVCLAWALQCNAWGHGCGQCPACLLRAQGWQAWRVGEPLS